jgi:transposase, IS6 family
MPLVSRLPEGVGFQTTSRRRAYRNIHRGIPSLAISFSVPNRRKPPRLLPTSLRAIDQFDQFGQVIDVLVAEKWDLAATRRFFTQALDHGPGPSKVSTDRAPAYPRVLDELLPATRHVTEQYANNAVEADHGRLKSRLRPMRGLKRLRSARVICTGHTFIQNLRRGHYELAIDLDPNHRIPAVFIELALAI